jgi:cytochrome d ubiquinol oxidase subunit II
MSQVLDFVPVWTLILGMAVFFYVLFDGFDLGVGMLFGLAPDATSRNTIMNTIAPVWDGNETWLVFGGLGLMAAFPLAFAIIIPAVYFPILVMLLALVFRGVAFEFRFRDAESKTFWDPHSVSAPASPPSRRAWCWVPSSRDFGSAGGNSPGPRSIFCPHSRC